MDCLRWGNCWVVCDGLDLDNLAARADDLSRREALRARGKLVDNRSASGSSASVDHDMRFLRSNPTPHPDARDVAWQFKGPSARADGRER